MFHFIHNPMISFTTLYLDDDGMLKTCAIWCSGGKDPECYVSIDRLQGTTGYLAIVKFCEQITNIEL